MQRNRLTKKNPKGYVIVRSLRIQEGREVDPKRLARLEIGHKSNRKDIPTEMSITDVDDVFTVLQNNSGEYITNIVEAELRFGTSPIGDAYGCMLTTRMIPVLYNMSGFVKKFQYPNIAQTLSTELGGANNVRFFVSEQGSVTPNASLLGNDIANCFVVAKEAYKVVKVSDDYKFSLIVVETWELAA